MIRARRPAKTPMRPGVPRRRAAPPGPALPSGSEGRAAIQRGLTRAILVATVLLFVPGLLDPFDPPKAMVIRVLGIPLLGGVLGHGFLAGRTYARWFRSLFRDRGSTSGWAASSVDLAVAGWVVAGLVSTMFSVSPRLSLHGELQQRDGWLTMLGLVGLYAAARRSHSRPEHVRSTVNLFLMAATIAAIYSIVQFAGRDPLAWANTARYRSETGTVLRPFAMLGNPILLGAVLAPALGIVVARLAAEPATRIGWIALSALLSTSLLVTLSRGAWLAGACALAAALLGAMLDPMTRSIRRAVIAIGAVAIPPVVLGTWVLGAPLASRVSESLAGGGSTLLRHEIARAAVALWRMRPWVGTGPGTFGLMFPGVMTPAYGGGLWNGLPAHAHSVALQVLATMGILGAVAGLLWLGGLIASLRMAPAGAEARRQRLELGVAGTSLAVLGAFNDVGMAGAALFVTLSALWAHRRDHEDAIAGLVRRRTAWALPLLLILALGLGAIPELRALAAAARARDALQQSLGATADARWTLLGRAVAAAARAASLEPHTDELWRLSCDSQLARGREALRRNDRAAASDAARRGEISARRAIELEPLRARNLQCLGNALALQARLAAPPGGGEASPLGTRSDSAFLEARHLAPLDARILIDQARAQLELRQPTSASATAERIVQLYPEAAVGHALLGGAEVMLGQRQRAAASLRAALAARWMDDEAAERRVARSYLRMLDSTEFADRHDPGATTPQIR